MKSYKQLRLNGTIVREHRTRVPHIPPGCVVDHADGDIHNNAPWNLRVVTRTANALNVVGRDRGVSRKRGKWRAYITLAGRQHSLGVYPTREEALAVRKHREAIEIERGVIFPPQGAVPEVRIA